MKRVRVILLFLLLGAMVNVAVAWGCAQLTPGALTEQKMRDSDLSVWRAQMRRGWPAEPYHRMKSTALGYTYEVMSGRTDFPVNASASSGSDPPAAWIKGIFKEWRMGWPLPCLKRHTWLAFGKNIPDDYVFAAGQERGGLVTLPENGLFNLPERRLPLDPVWTGLTFNTVFFAGVLWLLVLSAVWLRGYLRIKRGLCVKCAYDLRGAEHEVCPECGHTCEPRDRRTGGRAG